MFSSKSLTVSGLRFKVLVHFEVYFVNDISWGTNFFLHVFIQFSQHIYWKDYSSTVGVLGCLVHFS